MAPGLSMWKSKLCNEYPKELIERLDAEHHRTLKRLRGLPGNRRCADCAAPETNWASVNLGLFLCTRCASVHRGLGTHVSKVKSCMGTYLWGPDEIARMEEMGNARGARVYLGRAGAGAGALAPSGSLGPETGAALGLPTRAGDAALREWAVKKYEQRLWAISEKEEAAEMEEKEETRAPFAAPPEKPEKQEEQGWGKASGTPAAAENRIVLETKKSIDGGTPAAAVSAKLAPSLLQPKQPTGDFLDEFFESLFKEEGGATKKPISNNTPSEDFAACGFAEPAAWIQTPPAATASLEKENTNPFLCAQHTPKAAAGAAAGASGNPFLSSSGAPVVPGGWPTPSSVRKEATAEQHGLAKKSLVGQKAPAEIDWFEGW